METELKLALVDGGAIAFVASPQFRGGEHSISSHLVSTYFDTEDRRMQDAGVTLRVREDGEHRMQTVKVEDAAAVGLFARPEWEREIAGPLPVIDADAGPLMELVGDRALGALFETDVCRVERSIPWEGAQIALALDTGTIRAGEVERPLAELELELERGPVAALFSLARTLDAISPLRLAVRSKAERGYSLVGGAEVAAKAEPVRLSAECDVATAFATIAHSCLRQFVINEALMLAGDHSALPVHQARVGLRRLRSAFPLFRPILADDIRSMQFARELKELAAVLGAVRDLDVLIERNKDAIAARLAEERKAAFSKAVTRLEARSTRRLMLDLAEWLAIGSWRETEEAHAAITPLALAALEKRHRRVKRRGRHLVRLGIKDRHHVRIEAKKLRYATGFFAGLWTGKKARRRRRAFVDAIEQLQDELGNLNDAAHGAKILARLNLAEAAPCPSDLASTLKRAEAAYERLIEAKRFWR